MQKVFHLHRVFPIDPIDFAHAIDHIECLAHQIDHLNNNVLLRISPTALKSHCLIVSSGISPTV